VDVEERDCVSDGISQCAEGAIELCAIGAFIVAKDHDSDGSGAVSDPAPDSGPLFPSGDCDRGSNRTFIKAMVVNVGRGEELPPDDYDSDANGEDDDSDVARKVERGA